MTDDPRNPASQDEPGPDLEYDLAHDAVFNAFNASQTGATAPRTDAEPEHITVATDTPDYGGDYSYDMAHDVPGR
jgi:hypothetical protein